MQESQKYTKQFSPLARIALLAFPIIWAFLIYFANADDVDNARLLGYVTAPFLFSLIGVGIVWGVAKLARPKNKAPFKRPFLDHFIIWTLVITILNVLTRVSQAGQTV